MAEIALDITLSVESQDKSIEIAVDRSRKRMSMTVEKTASPMEEYAGPYYVRPRLYFGHVLETKGKSMAHNVNVDAIPVYETSNPAGGRTVTIGSV